MNKDSAVILSILSLCNLLPIVLPLLLPFLVRLSTILLLHILLSVDDELSAANIQGFDRKERPPMAVELVLNDDEEDGA